MYAHEIKVLVGPNFDEDLFRTIYSYHFGKVYIQPINEEYVINRENMDHCLMLQKKYPQVTLSTQLHKIWNVR